MLTLHSTLSAAPRQGPISRRSFLRIGALGAGGLSLSTLLAARAAGGDGFVRDKSVVFVFLNGGPSQFETFDPKMDAPPEIRTLFGEVKTSLPGVTFGGHFPQLAAMADRLAVVRSFQTGNTNHDDGKVFLTCGNPLKAPVGSIYSRLAGSTSPTSGLPNNVFVSRDSVGHPRPNVQTGFNFEGVFNTGALTAEHRAFHPLGSSGSGPGSESATGLLADMQLSLPSERFSDRRALLSQLDRLRRALEVQGQFESANKQHLRAVEVLLRGMGKAFDLSDEDPRLIERYDTSQMIADESSQRLLPKTLLYSPVALGKQMLMARRLCEAGCGFVTVGSIGWDQHGNDGFGLSDGMALLGPALDKAVSAFLADLKERGMSDKVLLVLAGEMGRTPRVTTRTTNGVTRPGRDHWGTLTSLVLAGGGLRMGQVIGASDRQGGEPATAPYGPSHLLATIMHTVFDAGALRITPDAPAEVARLVTGSEPIRELF